ncbi:hypothetical protein HPB50_024431 [Hyalomma asiaticum]|uniref:Uncharacterized protein n=1 Tax=Hyalomma asiaticum TaxID=266040 RepID=A0ACB7S3A6_HYAAI|nr:hypothetical protein HPB50_024431 [Hyalomma asiaticum]
MAEESMMSTAESGMEPPPGAPTGAGAQAEMITKKLANYWCIIGSIPLVMFLLVAIPTIFYVKKFSEYVNADYCDTKSCKELADVILKMGDSSEACKSFSAHVCKAKADYAVETLNKIHVDLSNYASDVILKMGDSSEACKSFSAHVCKAKADYAVETLNKIHNQRSRCT